MASLGEISLTGPEGSAGSGAAFRLASPPSQNAEIKVEDDWIVELATENCYAVARSTQDIDREEALHRGHGASLSDLGLPEPIWRFGLAGRAASDGETLYTVSRLAAPLRPGSAFDILESQQNLELVNVGTPKRRFPL